MVVYLQKPMVGGKRNTCVLNKVSLLYCGVQREYGTKGPTPTTRTNSYQPSKWSPSCLRYVAKNTDGGEKYRHRLTSSSMPTDVKLPLKCLLCLQILAQALDVSAWVARHHME